jgi:glycosyltransferase involved in cell wall biosynthesis
MPRGGAELRAAFVYPNARRQYAAAVARGEAPDTGLLGQNHLAEHGIHATIHDPVLTRVRWPAPLERAAWSVRELVLPFEVGRVDVVFAGLPRLLPLASRLRPGLATVVVSYGLSQTWRRSSPTRRRLLRASLESAGGVVCFGSSQADDLVELGAVSESRVRTLLLGVDEEWYTAVPPADGDSLVLAVGKDLARDYSTLATAVEGLDVRCEVIAFPRNLVGVRLPPNASARQVGYRELRELYARASCVVVPQRPDDFNFGADGGLTVLLEAMATGRPIVATERALLRDYVDDGVEALLVPPEDPTALREAILRLLGDRELARRMGEAGRARVERSHTTRGFAARLAPVFRDVVYPRAS